MSVIIVKQNQTNTFAQVCGVEDNITIDKPPRVR